MTRATRETILKCDAHMAVLDEAVSRLEAAGSFSFDAVVKARNLGGVAESIKWHFIRTLAEEFIEQALLPMARGYYLRHKQAEETVNPAKFIAIGRGKETAGFCVADVPHAHFVMWWVNHREAQAYGTQQALAKYLEGVNRTRLSAGVAAIEPRRLAILPDLQISC